MATPLPCVDLLSCAGTPCADMSKSKRRKMRDRRVAVRHALIHGKNLNDVVQPGGGSTSVDSELTLNRVFEKLCEVEGKMNVIISHRFHWDASSSVLPPYLCSPPVQKTFVYNSDAQPFVPFVECIADIDADKIEFTMERVDLKQVTEFDKTKAAAKDAEAAAKKGNEEQAANITNEKKNNEKNIKIKGKKKHGYRKELKDDLLALEAIEERIEKRKDEKEHVDMKDEGWATLVKGKIKQNRKVESAKMKEQVQLEVETAIKLEKVVQAIRDHERGQERFEKCFEKAFEKSLKGFLNEWKD
jgi:hypothetical protein